MQKNVLTVAKIVVFLLLAIVLLLASVKVIFELPQDIVQKLALAHEYLYRESIWWNLFFALLTGAVGSLAYITALYFYLVSNSAKERDIVIYPFLKKYSRKLCYRKMGWYCVVGGAIAMIFQVEAPTYVPVQSLILGATWPAVISQFLSGKLVSRDLGELDDMINPKSDEPVTADNFDWDF